jgi:nucleoside 2-deoxyribosyltransferase
MDKLTVYLAGPICGCNDSECNDWREYIIKELNGDYGFRNPMDRDYRDQYTQINMSPEIVELDKRDIDLSDIVIANITKHSAGTAMEMLYAWGRQKVVVAIANQGVQLSPWHIYHATKIVYSVDEAIKWIKEYVR